MLNESNVATRLPARDLDRARKFYSDKLGMEPIEQRPGGLRYRSGNSFFVLFESAGEASGSHTQMGWEVDDIEATMAVLKARGGVSRHNQITMRKVGTSTVEELLAKRAIVG